MDEVPLTFDVPSNKTVDSKGTKSVTVKTSGHEKTNYTVVLSCYADGTKLPPLLIFKGRYCPKKNCLKECLYMFTRKAGWMEEE